MIRRLSARLPDLGRSTRLLFLAGLLARLLVMPFAAHSDLMHIAWDGHAIVSHGRALGLEAVLRSLHAGWVWLVGPLLPPSEALWPHVPGAPTLNPFLGTVTSTEGWYNFVSQAGVFRTLFLLKLPYLLFDVGCAALAFELGEDRAKARRVLLFWWLNPVLFFAVYLFGRHEVIGLFFVLLSLFWLKKGRQTGGLLALGAAIAIRYYAVLLLPFYVLSLEPGWRARLRGLAVGLAPWAAVNAVLWATGAGPEAGSLATLRHTHYLLAMKLPVAEWDEVYLFPFAYTLLLLHRLGNRELGWSSLRQYCLLVLLALFATAYTGQSPQYWTWLLPFLALGAVEDRRLVPLHAAQIACLAVYSLIGGRSTAGYLFGPVAPDFFWSLPSPAELIGQVFPAATAISLGRTVLSAITVWMGVLVLRGMRTRAAQAGGEGAAG